MLYFFDQSQKGTEDNIRKGEIGYSTKLGWINFSHAIPDRTILIFNQFEERCQVELDSFQFTFSMDMKIRIPKGWLVAETEQQFLIPFGLDSFSRSLAFIEMFKSVSLDLEEMQGDFPYGLLSGSSASSFRNGDLTGNVLSVYQALYNDSNLLSSLDLISPEQSLIRNSRDNIDENKVNAYQDIPSTNDYQLRKFDALLFIFKKRNSLVRVVNANRSIFFN